MQNIQLSISPEIAFDKENYKQHISEYSGIPVNEISGFRLIKRSVDARKSAIKVNLSFEVYINEEPPNKREIIYQKADSKKPVIIIGSGPAGLFAALQLLEKGFKPIILERGKCVEKRKHDIAALYHDKILNENSNYCFGEGGAGTYSDGKLYTRSSKRGDVGKILSIFNEHGANDEILYETHAHIGTDKLPAIIASMCKTIIDFGGEIHFETKLSDLRISKNSITEVVAENGNTFHGLAIILATGHSADDVYKLLHEKKIHLESKPFALGVRVEHPQELIDKIQYHSLQMRNYLPASTYSLVEQIDGRGVFSFCMCPGGSVVPASTSNGSLVLNGMSSSQRNLKYANSGIVVSVDEADFLAFEQFGPLKGLLFRNEIEKKAFISGGSDFTAPAQLMTDFCKNKLSEIRQKTSYIPGINSVMINEILPFHVVECLKKAFPLFDRKMKGFYTSQALLLGVETRTSSPIRILRDKETLNHVQIQNLYPCGEGAGYSGGIVSSAIDGERCAEAIINCFS